MKEQPGVKLEQGQPLISIITIVRNGERYLEQTIQSVLNQTYQKIEYIVIDGVSTDGTLNIVKKYENYGVHWISEKDDGLYDALNKGSRLASGDYILYLHCGDYLYATDSIEQVVHGGCRHEPRPLLIIGNVIYAFKEEIFPQWVLPLSENSLDTFNPHHQGTLISATIYKKIFYNTLFRIHGDGDFWMRLRRAGLFQFTYVNYPVSIFRLGGVSNNLKFESHRYFEHEVSRYICLRDFRMLQLLRGVVIAVFKKRCMSVFGERVYYRYILYSMYRIRKKCLCIRETKN